MNGAPLARLRLLLWPAGVAFGVAAEAAYYGLGDVRHWIPDAAAGWALIACGLVAWSRRPRSATGPLMAAAGLAWFAGSLSPALVYLHRGPLVQLVLCYPSGRPVRWSQRAAVTVGYAAALASPLWDSDVTTIALAAALALAGASRHGTAGELERDARLPGTVAALALALVLAGGAIARLFLPAADVAEPTLLVYELVLCALAAGLLAGLDRSERTRLAVADLVLELGDRSGTLRDALAQVLGDATLDVGYWVPAAEAYVDAEGRPLRLPAPAARRRVTTLERAGVPLAVLIHDPAVLDDPELTDALGRAARLTAANAELQASVLAQVAEVDASRRRLLRAGDDERRRLEQRLDAGAQRRLSALASALERSRRRARQPELAGRIAQAEDQLACTLAELRQLAAGLHPVALARRGLRDSLAQLADRFPFAIDVEAPAERLPFDLEATVHFVCSEALANAAKHARGAHVSIAVRTVPEGLEVSVADDGVGGADPARGSGLRGLIDRVEALGGRLELSSSPGHGTLLTARIPLAGNGDAGAVLRGAAGGR